MTIILPWPPADPIRKVLRWTTLEIAELRAAYAASYGVGLDALAAKFGRHKTNISRKARSLGLTNQGRKLVPPEKRKIRKPKFASIEEHRTAMSKARSEWIAKNGHPRGALGMKHSEETKACISQKSKAFNAAVTPERRAAINLKAMKAKVAKGTYAPLRQKTTWKAGWREIGGLRKFYRSRWEANYARYLQWLKERGQIVDWKHEPKTFWFEGVKRGTCSYLPDFWVRETQSVEVYHEVKGWLDERSKTKIKRMGIYHPSVRLLVIREKEYMAIARAVKMLVQGWE